jgi:hypothetical protein
MFASDPSLWCTPVGQTICRVRDTRFPNSSSLGNTDTTSTMSSITILEEQHSEPIQDVIACRRPYRKCRQKGKDQVRRRLDFDSVTDLPVPME